MPQVTPRINPKNKNVEPFDRMLRRFKKQVERAGTIQECRDREYYVKPNQKRHKKNQDIKRKKKIDAKKAALAESRRSWMW
jgi:small subunit ribosomal protein S21|tara:strand:+ start:226 stop:468 length:243 start_codon:yes stop_codon:yes gene_type:complete